MLNPAQILQLLTLQVLAVLTRSLLSFSSIVCFSFRVSAFKMEFFLRDDVEVCSKEDGFLGSYFPATVIAKYGNSTYAVRYKTLLTEDESQPLVEVVGADEIRPEPPVVQPSGFDLYQEVDAFDNDGWWVGQVTGRKDSRYYVFFKTYGSEIAYPFSQLRVHLEWDGGIWVSSWKRAL